MTLAGIRTELNTWMQLSYSGKVTNAGPVEDKGVVKVPVSNGTVVVQMIDDPAAVARR